jgi:hypothetical protein
MGVDLEVILQHSLAPAEVPSLPQVLNADSASRLADAIEQYALVRNEWVTARGWHFEEPWLGFYLDAEGREVEPPPHEAPEPGVLYPMRSPDVYRKMSVADMWDMGEHVTVYGPASLHLDVARQCAVLSPACRWGYFLSEPRVQAAFRRVCYEMARLLGSPSAIYAPDSSYAASNGYYLALLEHKSFDEVIDWLREQYGPSPSSLSAIYTEEDYQRADGSIARVWRGDGYFVDTFPEFTEERTR